MIKRPIIPTIRPITFPFVSLSFKITAEKREINNGFELKIIAVRLAEEICRPICVTAILANTRRNPIIIFTMQSLNENLIFRFFISDMENGISTIPPIKNL